MNNENGNNEDGQQPQELDMREVNKTIAKMQVQAQVAGDLTGAEVDRARDSIARALNILGPSFFFQEISLLFGNAYVRCGNQANQVEDQNTRTIAILSANMFGHCANLCSTLSGMMQGLGLQVTESMSEDPTHEDHFGPAEQAAGETARLFYQPHQGDPGDEHQEPEA